MTWYEDFSQHWIQNSPSSISFSAYIFKIALKTAWNYILGRKDQFIVRLLHPKVSSTRAVTVLFIAVSPQALDKQLAHGGSQSLNMCWATQLIHILFKDALSLGCNHDCHYCFKCPGVPHDPPCIRDTMHPLPLHMLQKHPRGCLFLYHPHLLLMFPVLIHWHADRVEILRCYIPT